ncbi:helix-turn-helix domain-containing protein [Streptococcus intermedius]|jgi:transcriptional regulator, XRE family|uniref:helix-turn-helix domain-containing protein n=1 Tax=Streptococcus intermedius TaxID=1338 RepID=UPI000E3C9765|nr:helix-turn-helix transcriptional regulator [Streptococcus intermedius]RSJ12112.1 Helix-turn-helix domain protein [Streptococcus intermedius]
MLRNNLARLMVDRGIKTLHLSNETGIARSTITKIANNQSDKIGIDTINKLLGALDVRPSDFFDYIPYDFDFTFDIDFEDESQSQAIPEEGWQWGTYPAYAFLNVYRNGSKIKTIEYSGSFDEEPMHDGFDMTLKPHIDLKLSKEVKDYKDNLNFLSTIPVQFQTDIKNILETKISSYCASDNYLTPDIKVEIFPLVRDWKNEGF